jgi:nucleoside-diphosphate-sugar epimerase
MNVLVTGGAGFIGSHLVDKLVDDGHDVTVIDSAYTGHNFNPRATYIFDDCSDPKCTVPVVNGMDWVFHMAANPSVSRSVSDPVSSNKNNLQSTLTVLEACKAHGVKKVVLSSSSSVYGSHEGLCVETQPAKPMTPYALQKHASEQYGLMYHQFHGVPFVALRYFNVFGPRQSPVSVYSGVISRFSEAALKNQPVHVYGDGNQCRDFTYVSDIVSANIYAAKSDMVGTVTNVATGRSTTLLDVVSCLENACGVELKKVFHPARNGDIYTSKACTKSSRQLGFSTSVTFQTGLVKTLEWFKNP